MTITSTAALIDDIEERGVYVITHAAGLRDPDSRTSDGAQFANWVRNDIVETLRRLDGAELDQLEDDPLSPFSDIMRTVGEAGWSSTYDYWRAFTDLQAYELVDEHAEDVGAVTIDAGHTTSDIAHLGLSIAAERIITSIAAEVAKSRA